MISSGQVGKRAAVFAVALALLATATLALLVAMPIAFTGTAWADTLVGVSASEGSIDVDWTQTYSGSISWDASSKTLTLNNFNADMNGQLFEDESDDEDYYERQHAIQISASGFSSTPTVTLKLVGSNELKGDGWNDSMVYAWGANLKVEGPGSLFVAGQEDAFYVSGNLHFQNAKVDAMGLSDGCAISANGDISVAGASSSITVRKVGECAAIQAGGSFKATGGTVSVSDCKEGIFTGSGTLTVDGASITVKNPSYVGLMANGGNMNLKSGKVTITAGGSEQAEFGLYADTSKTITLGGATVNVTGTNYGIHAERGTVLVQGGTTALAKCNQGIYAFDGAYMQSGGTMGITQTTYGALDTRNVTITKGTLKIDGCDQGIDISNTFKMTAGTVSAINVKTIPLYASTKVNVTGGSLTLKSKNPKKYHAIQSSSIYVKPGCLKAVAGTLAKGVGFVAGGSSYTVGGNGAVTLLSYGGTSKKPTVNTVKFSGKTYKVSAIGAKAFATKRGKAITKLTLGANVASIGKNAFAGTTKLASINAKKLGKSVKLAKGAFAKCGKGTGKKLTVTCPKSNKKALKKAFVKAGLSKKATFK